MIVVRRSQSLFPIALCLTAFTLVGCGGTPKPVVEPPPQLAPPSFLAVSGDRLLRFDAATGQMSEFADSPLLRDVSALTTDHAQRKVYAIADSKKRPRLLRLDPDKETVEEVALVESGVFPVRTADALTFDPRREELFVAAGRDALSGYLLVMNPANGKARPLGRLSKTPQGEVDGLTMVGKVLFGVDHVLGETWIYGIGPRKVKLKEAGSLTGEISGLTFDPVGERTLATLDGKLAVLDLRGDSKPAWIDLGPDTPPLGALTVLPPPRGPDNLFGDGFEDGTTSKWSRVQSKN